MDTFTSNQTTTTAMGLRELYYSLPPRFRFVARRLYYLPSDTVHRFTRQNDMIPPKGMIFTGGGDFEKQGNILVRQLQDYCGLHASSAVLDIGCGIGRLAIPLTQVLGSTGKYEGFDIVKMGIDWCNKKIAPKHPNFRFKHIALQNDLYTDGANNAAEFTFPYPDTTFDIAVLVSVFTHMLPEEIDNYLAEIHRVLRPQGTCFATFFVLNEATKKGMQNKPSFNFRYDKGNYSLMNDNVKSANVAFEEAYLSDLINQHGFRIAQKRYGFWSGRPRAQYPDFQDIFILQKQ